MACKTTWWIIVVNVLLVCFRGSNGDTNAEILLRFRQSLANATALSDWSTSVELCSWTGMLCTKDGFVGLKLENMGLSGTIDMDTLAELPYVQSISFKFNNFNGPFPSNLNKIKTLRALFLSNNNFSGEIQDDAFSGMNLRKVNLENNGFTGRIPKSLTKLGKLVDLQLQNNKFEGEIPNFKQKDLVANLANNRLEGPIPAVLSDESSSSFDGTSSFHQFYHSKKTGIFHSKLKLKAYL